MNERGFTLVELLTVFVIVAVVTTFAAPSVNDYMNNVELKREANDLYQQFTTAKSQAVLTFSEQSIKVNAAPQSGITVTSTPTGNLEVVYQKDGTFKPATTSGSTVKYRISNSERTYEIIVGKNSPRIPVRIL